MAGALDLQLNLMMSVGLTENLGRNIQRRRREQNLSQQELSQKASLHRSYVGSVELGKRNLSIKSLYKIARALGTTISELTRGID